MYLVVRLSALLFFASFLFSCANTQMTPAQVLEMQDREEKIIQEQLLKKLDPIEGIWKNTRSGSSQIIAIYKRGNSYVVQELNRGALIFISYKKSEYEFYGDCQIADLLEKIEGKHRMVSVDDDTIDYVCARENYITNLEKILTDTSNVYRCLFCKKNKPDPQDYSHKARLIRVYPENLKEHNSQY